MVFSQVTPVFITQITPFNRYSVALTVCQHQRYSRDQDREVAPLSHGDHILGEGEGQQINKQTLQSAVTADCGAIWGTGEWPERRPREKRSKCPKWVKSRHNLTVKR